MLKLIAAIGKNRELGKDGGLCFHIPEDMKFFKETTMGHAVLMGYKTWESLPGALPGRKNYVLSRGAVELPEGVEQVSDLTEFIAKWRTSAETCFVIGGGSVYQQLLPECQELYLTEVEAECPGADTFFPEFDKSKYTKTILGKGESHGINYAFAKYSQN